MPSPYISKRLPTPTHHLRSCLYLLRLCTISVVESVLLNYHTQECANVIINDISTIMSFYNVRDKLTNSDEIRKQSVDGKQRKYKSTEEKEVEK